jgi:flagellin-specific chaperone FliS
LLALYDFIQRALLDANYRQEDEGLRQAEQLLATLHEAWVTLQRSAAPTAEPLYAPVGSAEPEYAGMHQWRA